MGHALPPKKRPPHLHEDTFALFDLEDTAAGRRNFVRRLDEIAAAEADLDLETPQAPQGGEITPNSVRMNRFLAQIQGFRPVNLFLSIITIIL
jgi:hypothetical protein